MSEIVHIVAVISPLPGKEDRIAELLQQTAQQVQAKEPDTLRYHLHKRIGVKGSPPELIVIETYKNKAAIDVHSKTPHFLAFSKALKEEGLVGKPLSVMVTKAFGGFESRL